MNKQSRETSLNIWSITKRPHKGHTSKSKVKLALVWLLYISNRSWKQAEKNEVGQQVI